MQNQQDRLHKYPVSLHLTFSRSHRCLHYVVFELILYLFTSSDALSLASHLRKPEVTCSLAWAFLRYLQARLGASYSSENKQGDGRVACLGMR